MMSALLNRVNLQHATTDQAVHIHLAISLGSVRTHSGEVEFIAS